MGYICVCVCRYCCYCSFASRWFLNRRHPSRTFLSDFVAIISNLVEVKLWNLWIVIWTATFLWPLARAELTRFSHFLSLALWAGRGGEASSHSLTCFWPCFNKLSSCPPFLLCHNALSSRTIPSLIKHSHLAIIPSHFAIKHNLAIRPSHTAITHDDMTPCLPLTCLWKIPSRSCHVCRPYN